jgi:dipeptidyl aminopeptidase/acylaminoacyl peptidase
LGADRIASASRGLSQTRIRDGAVYWLESRPDEGGRQVVVCHEAGRTRDVSAAGVDVRSGVHEYGGGEYGLLAQSLVYVRNRGEGVATTDGNELRGVVPGARYADFVMSPDRRFVVAVEEDASTGSEPTNRLVAFDRVDGSREVLCADHDFVSSPCFSPAGDRLAYLVWDHPNMPWDGTELQLQAFSSAGPAGSAHRVAGSRSESIFQPGFSPNGVLTFVSDASGWWNLCQLRGDAVVAIAPAQAEFGRPQWVLGMRSWAFESENCILVAVSVDGDDRLERVDVLTGGRQRLPLPYTSIGGLDVSQGRAVFIGASADRAPAVVLLDLGDLGVEELAHAFEWDGDVAVPDAITFASQDGREAHAFLYQPSNPEVSGPGNERPPLIVKGHGGPTSATNSALKLSTQFWTSRGFALVDVNYGGSTGYGRPYRNRLAEAWGVVDVEDCVAAAAFVSSEGLADPARQVITGGSAGGYTTLCALTFHDAFAAGASHYGIGDLEALATDTHKFESRYLDGLVGAYPETKARYRERSPIHFTEQLSCPVIFFQGLEDKVVPPGQAEAMVDALAQRGIAHAYVPFEGEGHGFRKAENIRAALEGELWFYGRILGFETQAPSRPFEIRSGPAG